MTDAQLATLVKNVAQILIVLTPLLVALNRRFKWSEKTATALLTKDVQKTQPPQPVSVEPIVGTSLSLATIAIASNTSRIDVLERSVLRAHERITGIEKYLETRRGEL